MNRKLSYRISAIKKLSISIVSEVESLDGIFPRNNLNTDYDFDIGDPALERKKLKFKKQKRLIISHLNINSLRNKFESIKNLIYKNVDIFLISGTKIDKSFPITQFNIDGYTQFRRDRNFDAGGIIMYARDDIKCREIKTKELPSEFEGFFIELTLHKSKWILFADYNPPKSKISYFLNIIGKVLDRDILVIMKI